MTIDLLNEMKCNPKSLSVVEEHTILALLHPDYLVRESSKEALSRLYDSYRGVFKDHDKLFLLFDIEGEIQKAYVCNVSHK